MRNYLDTTLQSGFFLVSLALLCGAVSFYGLNILISCVAKHRLIEKIRSWLQERKPVKNGALLFFLLVLQFLQLQRSSLSERAYLVRVGFIYYVSGLFFLLTLFLLLLLILRRERAAAVVSCVIVTIYSVANFYVILFHGGPLYPNEFANAGTAMNVLSSYSIVIGPQVVDTIALFLAEIFLAEKLYKAAERKIGKDVLLLIGSAAVVFVLFFSPISLRERYSFSWQLNITYDGFVHSAASNLKKCLHPIRKPDGYDGGIIRIPDVNNPSRSGQNPDIIVIVNESFCDLSAFSDVKTDRDYLDGFYNIEGAAYGYAFSPEIGGGTNKTEFEILTSDSMYLLNSPAPFSYIDFNEKNSTCLSYLKSLGYESYAMHSMPASNYYREFAYPAMGFDHVYLGDERACDFNCYGNRQALDEDEYKGLISLFEQKADSPRFFFLLTFQNHGGYEQNDPSYDLIHTTGDYGDLTDDVNEYLTSVSLSSAAFHDLIAYLSECERPVVLCMVGDHAPSFINQLEGNRDMTPDETELWRRAVPFVMWSNFENSTDGTAKYASMTDLIPLLLKNAGMPLTPFYQQLLHVHESIPVRTPYGICMDSEGALKRYGDGDYPKIRYNKLRKFKNR